LRPQCPQGENKGKETNSWVMIDTEEAGAKTGEAIFPRHQVHLSKYGKKSDNRSRSKQVPQFGKKGTSVVEVVGTQGG